MGCQASKVESAQMSEVAAGLSEKSKRTEYLNSRVAGKISIYYGSRTGTAEGLAKTLGEVLRSYGFDARVIDANDFKPPTLIRTRTAIFLMATTGDGQPTDNAKKLFHWLHSINNKNIATDAGAKNRKNDSETRKAPDSCTDNDPVLAQLSYAVFGLGNSLYDKYNAVGKETDALLASAGGNRILALTLGDDHVALEDDYEAWKARLLPRLMKMYHPNADDLGFHESSASFTGLPLKDSPPKPKNMSNGRENDASGPFNMSRGASRAASLLPGKVDLQFVAIVEGVAEANRGLGVLFRSASASLQAAPANGTPVVIDSINGSYSSWSNSECGLRASSLHFAHAQTARVVSLTELCNLASSCGTCGGQSADQFPVSPTSQASKDTACQSTLLMDFSLEGTSLVYNTADNLSILPENDPETVEAVVKALRFDLDKLFILKPPEDVVVGAEDPSVETSHSHSSTGVPKVKGGYFKAMFPTPCTVRDAFTKYLDVKGHLRMSLLKQLHPYLQDDAQKQWLAKQLSPQFQPTFRRSLKQQRASFASLIAGPNAPLSSLSIPLSDLLHILPVLQPRTYTIASSASVYPNNAHIIVSVGESPGSASPMNPLAPNEAKIGSTGAIVPAGVGTAYLKSLVPGSKINMFVQPSTFRLPPDISTPITMIGLGTGIAPMRALIQERHYQSEHGPPVKNESGMIEVKYNGLGRPHSPPTASMSVSHSNGTAPNNEMELKIDPHMSAIREAPVSNSNTSSNVSRKSFSHQSKDGYSIPVLQPPPVFKVGENVLYFGCRSAANFLCRDEMLHYRDNTRTLNQLHVAISREGHNKAHVQDLMQEDEAAVALVRQLEEGGYIYVCGVSAMGTELKEVICSILMQFNESSYPTRKEAEEYVQELQRTGRYVQELY